MYALTITPYLKLRKIRIRKGKLGDGGLIYLICVTFSVLGILLYTYETFRSQSDGENKPLINKSTTNDNQDCKQKTENAAS